MIHFEAIFERILILWDLFSYVRFIQMTPQYFFYNLPPSESKDLLQDIMDHGSAAPSKGKRKPQTSSHPDIEEQANERCTIQ